MTLRSHCALLLAVAVGATALTSEWALAVQDATHEATPLTRADDVQARFDDATRAMAAGEHRTAAEMLLSVAEKHPDSDLADDALFSAAKLYEERLGEPLRARALYVRLRRDYPDSRAAMAAARRAESISDGVGPDDQGAQALARFTDILQHFTERGEQRSLTLAQALLAEHPDWTARTKALAWLGAVHQRAGRHQRALDYYLQAAEAATVSEDRHEALIEAYRGAGDAALALGRFDRAEALFRSMPLTVPDASGAPTQTRDSSLTRSLDDSLERVARARLRARLYDLAFLALALIALALIALLRTACHSWRATWLASYRPPFEAVFMVPIAALLMATSLTAHYAVAPAVTIICVGGVAITWLSGAGLRAGKRRPGGLGRWRPATHALLSAVAVLALSYIALHHNRLIDMIVETVRFGPEV